MKKEFSFLVVEDEFIISSFIKGVLESKGYSIVAVVTNADDARKVLKEHKVDCILLDINIDGKEDGLQFAKTLIHSNVGIIFISALHDYEVLEEAKDLSPYGFLVKPFNDKNLLASVMMAMSRIDNDLDDEVENSIIDFDEKFNTVIYNNMKVKLTKKEFFCLKYFYKNKECIVDYQVLKKDVWNSDTVSDSTVRELINRLRNKIPGLPLTNEYGKGYLLSLES